MTDELKAALRDSGLEEARAVEAVKLAMTLATDIAKDATGSASSPDFLAILLKLFEILLPIILELFKPS